MRAARAVCLCACIAHACEDTLGGRRPSARARLRRPRRPGHPIAPWLAAPEAQRANDRCNLKRKVTGLKALTFEEFERRESFGGNAEIMEEEEGVENSKHAASASGRLWSRAPAAARRA